METAKSYLDGFLHPRLTAEPSAVLRAKIWIGLGLCASASSLIMGIDHLVRGPRAQGVGLLLAFVVGLGLLAVLRRTGRLALVGNVTCALAFAAVTGAVYIRGGAGAPGQFAYGAIPMVAVLTAGWWSGVAWSAAVFAELAIFILLHARGAHIPVRVPEASRQFSDMIMAIVVTIFFVGFSFAYEWYRLGTSRARERAERERSRAERQRQRAEHDAHLVEASRLAAIGQLAAGVGHEINNPLTYVSGNIEHAQALLRNRDGLDTQVAELNAVLSDALSGARRVARIVSDLGTYARRPDAVIGVVSVQRAVDEAIKMAKHQLEHRARLSVEQGEPVSVRIDETHLTQVVLNLLINAAQAVCPGQAADNHITVTIDSLENDEVTIAIRDTGEGIAADVLPRVFDPFFTTKPVGEGTGLGLPVCRNIAEQYGGTLTVQSTPTVGTTVTLTLPIDHTEPSVAPKALALAHAPSKARILAVDDEPIMRKLLTRSLAANGHDVHAVSSGRQALEALAKATYDVILCDVMMPELTGIDVHHALQRQASPAAGRLIFLTGGVFSPDLARELDAVDAPVIAKPWTHAELEQAIAGLLARQRAA